MSEPICPFCGDGPEALGTMYHIECVEKLMDRIAELEAKTNAAIDHMTEVGVDACRERDDRIAELEAEVKRCEQLRDEYHRLVGERPDTTRIAALEAELAATADVQYTHQTEQAEAENLKLIEIARQRHNDWAACVMRAEQAEARYSDVVAEHENELALRLEAEAEVAVLKARLHEDL